jgi:predicted DNA-binding transcriptional regulator AlpA
MSLPKSDVPERTAELHSLTVKEFCDLERIGETFYYKLRAQGRAPREMRLGSGTVRIPPSARIEWHERMLADTAQLDAIEAERRSRVASEKAKLGTESPDHPCRRKRGRPRKAVAA